MKNISGKVLSLCGPLPYRPKIRAVLNLQSISRRRGTLPILSRIVQGYYGALSQQRHIQAWRPRVLRRFSSSEDVSISTLSDITDTSLPQADSYMSMLSSRAGEKLSPRTGRLQDPGGRRLRLPVDPMLHLRDNPTSPNRPTVLSLVPNNRRISMFTV